MSVLGKIISCIDLKKMPFMSAAADVSIGGIKGCSLTRCGYTGEDGFEISVKNEDLVNLANILIEGDIVRPSGLAARDSLRLEAGLCLYGHEITEEITPIEASLLWTIGKRRRQSGGFIGAEVILDQIKNGVSRKRVGLICDNIGAIPREGTILYKDDESEEIGHITSGAFSPCLSKAIGIGYVKTEHKQIGRVKCAVRKSFIPAALAKTPFLPSNYYRV
eukprot:GHVL01015654.1.p1 GENE.GHVL01015654.1~~GHVL01015654.1.p1  ORF type:complete len:220 (+),score=30.20 GHVL01015654.1:621-1280(+)